MIDARLGRTIGTDKTMIAIAAALLMVTGATCVPVPGAVQLWQPDVRWVIVGEMHGTNEAPDAFANLVCLAAASKRPVTVALEFSPDDQSIIDSYLASNGGADARSNLSKLHTFSSGMQDGRGSLAFLRLFERLRVMKRAGQISGVVASDIDRTVSSCR